MTRTFLPYIFLLGPSGVGKSTVGPLLAQKLNFQFIDTDQWIERQSGYTIADLFKTKGEGYFRALEKKLLVEDLPQGPHVVACGGGVATITGVCEALKAKGLVVALEASITQLSCRLKGRLEHRPLLEGGSLEEKLRQQVHQRQHFYESIRYKINTDRLSPEEVADRLRNLYQGDCRLISS